MSDSEWEKRAEKAISAQRNEKTEPDDFLLEDFPKDSSLEPKEEEQKHGLATVGNQLESNHELAQIRVLLNEMNQRLKEVCSSLDQPQLGQPLTAGQFAVGIIAVILVLIIF